MTKKTPLTVMVSSEIATYLRKQKDDKLIKSISATIRNIVEREYKGKLPLEKGQKSIIEFGE